MKLRLVRLAGLVLLLSLSLAACTARVYDVPVEQWDAMSEGQRQEAIRGYYEREKLREERRIVEARAAALAAEQRAIELRREEQARAERVEKIYRGDTGQLGDLIRVTLREGRMRLGMSERAIEPLSFSIASGEIKTLTVRASGSRASYGGEMLVGYLDGTLYLDMSAPDFRSGARLVYEPGWRRGASYSVTSDTPLRLREVRVEVEILPHRHPFSR